MIILLCSPQHVVCGTYHVMGIDGIGRVRCWGDSNYAQCGSIKTKYDEPVPVPDLEEYIQGHGLTIQVYIQLPYLPINDDHCSSLFELYRTHPLFISRPF